MKVLKLWIDEWGFHICFGGKVYHRPLAYYLKAQRWLDRMYDTEVYQYRPFLGYNSFGIVVEKREVTCL